jgi:hypothetical protein
MTEKKLLEGWRLTRAAYQMISAAASIENSDPLASEGLLNRAVSSFYYSVFSATAWSVADYMTDLDRDRALDRWTRVYRSIDHRDLDRAGNSLIKVLDPESPLARVFTILSKLRLEREAADYVPHWIADFDQVTALEADATEALAILEDLRTDRAVMSVLAVEVLIRQKR